MTAPDLPTLRSILVRLEAATGPDRELDFDVWHAVIQPEGYSLSRTGTPAITAFIDAAVALLDRTIPGAWYVLARGKTRADEPLYGARIMFGADTSLGDGEHDTEQAIALCTALVKALIARADA